MWNLDDILSSLVAALRDEHARLTHEQAVHNIDALDEVALHPILAAGLSREGWGVLREQPYPAEWRAKPGRRSRALPDESQRMRCDLVLTAKPGQSLADPLCDQRAMLEDLKQAERTLFAPIAEARAARAVNGALGAGRTAAALRAIPPDEACWLELKVVGQFAPIAGVPGPNPQYGSALVSAVMADLRKLAADPAIIRGALALVLFTRDEATARHDLRVVSEKCIARGALSSLPRVMGTPILDRIGNAHCTVAMFEAALNLSEPGAA